MAVVSSALPASAHDDEVIISVRNLRKYFPIQGGVFSRHIGDVRAVDGVSFDIHVGETVGLVGESGCGKTTVGRTLLRLTEPTSGHVYYRPSAEQLGRMQEIYPALETQENDGGAPRTRPANAEALLKELDEIANQSSIFRMKGPRLAEVRGKLQIVFQDPFSSLNPRMLVRDVVSEPLLVHHWGTRQKRFERVAELMQEVGLNPDHLYRFPHEFSGGQRQRIGIARALALRPEFIVLDEPTSALDVSVQAQVLNILTRLQSELNLSYLFISHHLSVVRAISRHVVVMYLGKVVERAPTEELFNRPLHPYTQALLAAIPIPDPDVHRDRIILSGDVPSPANPPPGCRFHTRCPAVMPVCSKVDPPLLRLAGDHWVACHLYPEGADAVTIPLHARVDGASTEDAAPPTGASPLAQP